MSPRVVFSSKVHKEIITCFTIAMQTVCLSHYRPSKNINNFRFVLGLKKKNVFRGKKIGKMSNLFAKNKQTRNRFGIDTQLLVHLENYFQ